MFPRTIEYLHWRPNNGCEGDKRTPYGRMSKFVFSLFSIVLSQLIDTLLLHFYFVEGWVKLICWVDFSLTLSHHFGLWIRVSTAPSPEHFGTAFGLLMVLEDEEWNSSTLCADHVKPW